MRFWVMASRDMDVVVLDDEGIVRQFDGVPSAWIEKAVGQAEEERLWDCRGMLAELGGVVEIGDVGEFGDKEYELVGERKEWGMRRVIVRSDVERMRRWAASVEVPVETRSKVEGLLGMLGRKMGLASADRPKLLRSWYMVETECESLSGVERKGRWEMLGSVGEPLLKVGREKVVRAMGEEELDEVALGVRGVGLWWGVVRTLCTEGVACLMSETEEGMRMSWEKAMRKREWREVMPRRKAGVVVKRLQEIPSAEWEEAVSRGWMGFQGLVNGEACREGVGGDAGIRVGGTSVEAMNAVLPEVGEEVLRGIDVMFGWPERMGLARKRGEGFWEPGVLYGRLYGPERNDSLGSLDELVGRAFGCEMEEGDVEGYGRGIVDEDTLAELSRLEAGGVQRLWKCPGCVRKNWMSRVACHRCGMSRSSVMGDTAYNWSGTVRELLERLVARHGLVSRE